MAIVLKDRVKQTATAPGTGTITLGSTPTGFQAFSAIGNGNVTYFAIVDAASGAWEVNYGTYTASGTTLSRNATPLSSSAAGALVNFTGTVDVFCTYPSSKAIYEETTGNVLIDGGPITVIGTGVTSYTTFSAALGELYANINSFAQLYAQNLNGGSEASADFVAYNDLGDGVNNFVDMGINSSNYSSATYPIFTPGSAYVFNDGGEMIIGSATDDLLLFAGGVATTDWAIRVDKTSKLVTTKAGLTLGGALTGVGGSFTSPVTTSSSMASPGSTEFVTKSYVDTATSTAFVVHAACRLATTTALPANTYSNGTGGVGATLTGLSVGQLTIDGVNVAVGNRVLIKNEAAPANNGAYTVTVDGSAAVYVLTRATDFDTVGAGEIANNAYFYITAGTTNAGSSWVLAQTAAITVGTTALPFDLFSASQIYTGGTNINVTGTVISLTGTVAPTNGGTGVATVTTGDLLYGSATNTWSKLAAGAAYKSLVMNAGGTNVEWNAVALNQSGAVSGALPATNGGTGLGSYTLGDTLYSSAANTISALPGNTTTTKKFLVQTGTGSVSAAPAWGTISGSDVSGNISGSAGSVANALTLGTYLTGTSFNGSAAVTATVDATSANTASKVVARDASGNFSAGTITATLSGNATNVSGIVAFANGGTGATTRQDAMDALAGATTSGQYLRGNGSDVVMSTIQAADVPTLNQNTTGNAATATNATNVTVTTSATASAFKVPFANTTVSTTGNYGLLQDDTATFTYNPSTNTLTAVTFSGALSGNATSATTATSATSATTATTATTANALNTANNYQVNSLGVGTAGSGTAGEIRATNNITAYYSSDIKFKENVRNIPNAAATAKAIGGKLFDWKDSYIEEHGGEDGYFVQKHDFGVIAQDVLAKFPVAVRTRPDGSLAVDYEKLSALALAALAEHEDRIAKLEALVAKLIEG